MTAPALVALAHGSRDPRSAQTIKALVDEVRAHAPRPARRAGVPRARQAVLRHRSSTGSSRPGYDEIVVVPLLLTEAYHAKVDVPDGDRRGHRAPRRTCEIRATDVLGLEPVFLEVLDRRLRDALSDARVRELDALVLAAAGSSDQLANQAVARLARLWGAKHKLPDRRRVRLGRSPGHRRGRPRSSAPRAAGTSRSARCSWRPGFLPDRAAELAARGRRGRRVGAARRRPGGGPDDPGALRRRRRRARPGLSGPVECRGRRTA